jgi:hypothetical protein
VAKKRGRENAYDMVLSLSAVSIFVIVVLAVTWRPQHQTMQEVDYVGAQSSAIAASNWPIYVPSQVPSGYQVTAARFEVESYGQPGDSRWYLGLTSQNNKFISLWQSDGTLKKIKAAATNNGSCAEKEIIAGSEWEKCFSEKPETRAYLKTQGEVTIIISGTAAWDELKNFINSLTIAK